MRSKSYKGKKKFDNKSREKDFGRNSKEYAKLDSKGRDNDPNFYFSNAELANQASQLSFQNVIGLGDIYGYTVPSICKVCMNPTPGVTVSPGTQAGIPWAGNVGYAVNAGLEKKGINLMSSKLYTMLSTFTGRTSNYAPQDVAMMILAISSIAELSEHIRRMFGIALTYNARNRNLPLGLLRTMNIKVDDFMANIPGYRMRFNVAMTRINQIPLLDNIGYIRKARDLYQRVYLDSVSPMAQIFYYSPYTVWELDETLDPNGSVLKPIDINLANSAPQNLSVLLTHLERMITSLLESSTLNLIYADLLNMANKIKVPVWQFDYLAENYIVVPEFNANALLQFHHMRALDDPITLGNSLLVKEMKWHYDDSDLTRLYNTQFPITSSNYVVCDPNTNNVIYNPAFNDSAMPFTIVDMATGDPSIEDKIEALRFTSIASGSKVLGMDLFGNQSTNWYDTLMCLPDHYVVMFAVYKNVDYTDGNPPVTFLRKSVAVNGSPSTNLEKWTRRPFFYGIDTNQLKVTDITGDLDFYTTVDFTYLSRVNELMFTGLFDFRV